MRSVTNITFRQIPRQRTANTILKKALILILIVIVLDQIFKIWVKTSMTLGQEIPVLGNWFILHFTENNGMAFGIQLSGNWGKLTLSIFRIIAVIAIGWYIVHLTKKKAHTGLILCMSLIFAGALGNILDSAFYGILFSNSSYHSLAAFMPENGGYAPFLHGRVVDMLYFPLIEGTTPEWFPIWPNEHFIFFRPVFNIADSAITIGVVILILFQKRFFKKEDQEKNKIQSEHAEVSTDLQE